MPADPVAAKGGAAFETAAAHASAAVPLTSPGRRAREVCQALSGQRYECASHIVVCEGETFLGILRIEDLLAAAPESPVDGLVDREAPVVRPGVDQEIAAWQAVRHGESALAVVDREGRFLGIISPHQLLAVLLAADFVGWFEGQLQQRVILAFFIPGIVYLADAVGTQTETVVVRGLSVGVGLQRMLGRELLAGVAIGLALAVVAGPLVWWRWGDAEVALCVGLALFAACSTATLAAMALPWLLDAVGLDPAFGSGPLATVVQDLLSIVIYFFIATGVVR